MAEMNVAKLTVSLPFCIIIDVIFICLNILKNVLRQNHNILLKKLSSNINILMVRKTLPKYLNFTHLEIRLPVKTFKKKKDCQLCCQIVALMWLFPNSVEQFCRIIWQLGTGVLQKDNLSSLAVWSWTSLNLLHLSSFICKTRLIIVNP